MSDNIRGDRAVSFVRHCKSAPKGAFVEVGVFEGNSAIILAAICEDREFHMYESWEGLPDLTKHDKRCAMKGQFKASFQDVRSVIENHKCHTCDTYYHNGLVQDTFDVKDFPDGVSFLHIDVDLYETTKFCLESFWDIVVDGGIVQIDDYGHYPGCRKAVRDFFKEKGLKINNVFKKQPSPVYVIK